MDAGLFSTILGVLCFGIIILNIGYCLFDKEG